MEKNMLLVVDGVDYERNRYRMMRLMSGRRLICGVKVQR
jgi:hypothetical protein